VRDNIHAADVCSFFEAFLAAPRVGAVYNLGGGRANSISILEAIERFEGLLGRRLGVDYVDQARIGDHICYISDLRKLYAHYPKWRVTKSLDDIFSEIHSAAVSSQAV